MSKWAYGGDCLSHTQCYRWYQRFKSDKTSTEDDHKTGWPFTSTDYDNVSCDSWKSLPNYLWSFWRRKHHKSSCQTILTEEVEMHCAVALNCSHVTPRLFTFGEAWDDSSPHPPTLQIRPLQIHSERSLTSDNRKERRQFEMEPTHYPVKWIPELEKTLEAEYKQSRGVLWRR